MRLYRTTALIAGAVMLHVPSFGMSSTYGGGMTQEDMAGKVASGTFQVTLTPNGGADATVSSMIIAKTFHGDLEAQSAGQMLAIRTPVAGSAGYVAMERVTGRLRGTAGSFALQHSGTMDKGAASLSVSVVPDSGTGDLSGIRGQMEINVVDGRHDYFFRYTLPQH